MTIIARILSCKVRRQDSIGNLFTNIRKDRQPYRRGTESSCQLKMRHFLNPLSSITTYESNFIVSYSLQECARSWRRPDGCQILAIEICKVCAKCKKRSETSAKDAKFRYEYQYAWKATVKSISNFLLIFLER